MTNKETAPAYEITVELDAQGIPVWTKKDGNVVIGLEKQYFFANVKKEDMDDAQRAFIDYTVELKKAKMTFFEGKLENLKTEIEAYEVKRKNIGKTLTDEEKLEQKIARMTRSLEAAKAAKAKLEAPEEK